MVRRKSSASTEPCRLCAALKYDPGTERLFVEQAQRERPANANLDRLLAMAPEEPTVQRLAALVEAKWEPSRRITIGFEAPPDPKLPSVCMGHLETISFLCNLSYRQVPYAQAEVRVRFDRGRGLWSYIGTGSLLVPRDQPTANLGDMNFDDPADVRRCVLHELGGHAAGMVHAQNVAEYQLDLDVQAIVRDLARSQGWSLQQAAQQWEAIANERLQIEFGGDRLSIMAYPVDSKYDRRGIGVPWNNDFSPSDRLAYPLIYGPPAGSSAPPEPPVVVAPPEPPGPPPEPMGPPLRRLAWASGRDIPYRAGEVVRLLLPALRKRETITVRVRDADPLASPLLDVAAPGTAPVRLPMGPGLRRDTLLGTFAAGPGDHELRIRFVGGAPAQFRVLVSRRL